MEVTHVRVLKDARTIAVVGMSKNPEKQAHSVPAFLKEKGYRIIPVNPTADEILGEKSYPSLDKIPEYLAKEIDVVNVFRPPEEAMDVVRQVIDLRRRTGGKPWAIWFQIGTATKEAIKYAREHGLIVVPNMCMREEYKKHFGTG